uniref:Nematode cuticle collagen N-terminal domain-containing protein n=1 Tax=Ditylenchus dipsaci TaxID=166011 RepID=A0A915DM56_9BILA
MEFVHAFNTEFGVRLAYTFDAGPNCCIILEEKTESLLLNALKQCFNFDHKLISRIEENNHQCPKPEDSSSQPLWPCARDLKVKNIVYSQVGDHAKETDQHRQMRRIAFVAVVVSTVAVIASVVTLPMLYNYVQSFQSHLQVETDYCKARSRDMWLEMTALQLGKGHANRIKRGWLFGQWVPEAGYEEVTLAAAVHLAPAEADQVEQDPVELVPAEAAHLSLEEVPVQATKGQEVAMVSPLATDMAQWSTLSQLQSAALVIKEHLVQPVQKDQQERTEKTEITERMDPTEKMLCSTPLNTPNPALCAQLDLLDLKDLLGQKDHQDQRDLQESPHVMESPVNKACKDSPVQSADQEEKDHVEHPVNLDVLSQYQDHKLQQDHPDLQETKDQKDNLAQTDSPSKDHPVFQEMLANQVSKDVLDHPDHPETLVKMERKAAATTAPSQEHHQAIKLDVDYLFTSLVFLPSSTFLVSLLTVVLKSNTKLNHHSLLAVSH